MRIAEIFQSIQGEGKLTGVPSIFIRTSRCNLRCVWCDTPHTSWNPEGKEYSLDRILDCVREFPATHVVLTGGEPLIAPGVEPLSRKLVDAGYHLTIETAATVVRDVVGHLASISPKLSNSTPWLRASGRWAKAHERARIRLEVIRRLMTLPDYQLKFVVDRPDDLAEIDELLVALAPVPPEYVLLMPQGVTATELAARAPWLAEICLARGFRFCPRLHIELFGNTRGT
jgi:7-carboxy-7-deazaguanine synthase